MVEGPVFGKILAFSLPLICTDVLQLFFNAADIIVVGRFSGANGANALAAVGSTSVVINLLTNLLIGLSIGANVLFAQYLGAKDNKSAEETLHTSLSLGLLGGIILTVLGILFIRPVLEGMGSPAEIIDLSEIYLKIYFLGMPAMMLYNFGSAILRAKGDTKRPLFILSAAGVINIFLNLFFVIVMKMSVAGVAIATVISQTVSALLLVCCLVKEEEPCRLIFDRTEFSTDKLKKILKIGVPAGLQGVVFSLSNVFIQSSVNSFGAVAMAGSAAAQNLENFVDAAVNSFYQANVSFTGQCYGARQYHRIPKILISCLICTSIVGLVIGNAFFLNGRALIGIYNGNPEVYSYGIIRMQYLCIFYFLCGCMNVLSGSVRGMGYSVLPMVVTLVGACLFRVLWILLFFPQNHTLDALFALYPVTWIMTAVAHLVCFLIIYRKLKKAGQRKDAVL